MANTAPRRHAPRPHAHAVLPPAAAEPTNWMEGPWTRDAMAVDGQGGMWVLQDGWNFRLLV